MPVPWLDRCPHCREGRQKRVPLKIRKLVQVLCSNKPDGPDGYRFTLPNHYRMWPGDCRMDGGSRQGSRGTEPPSRW